MAVPGAASPARASPLVRLAEDGRNVIKGDTLRNLRMSGADSN